MQLGLLAAAARAILAADQSPPPETKPEPSAEPDIIITSESASMDFKGGLTIYRGNVKVDDPGKMLLTAALLTIIRPSTNIESIVAETNVVIDLFDPNGEKTHALGARAVYTASNNIVELTGNPSMENSQGSMTADLIILNRLNNNLDGKGNVKTKLRSSFLATTNNPPKEPRTNAPLPAATAPKP